MCGTNAIYGYAPGAPPVDHRELVAVRDRMAHRGPDGAGAWVARNQRVGLGHRRLAIIGLGPQGAQPMHLPHGCRGGSESAVASFNGEIYNYRSLRQELISRGHAFGTETDTEVLLHLYEDYKEDLVLHLRGMFAFALWDELRERLVLGRDSFGIKPLYYADDGATIRVASEVRALQLSKRVGDQPDEAAVAAFFLFGSIPEPRTFLADVRCLPAGSTMVVNAAGPAQPRTFFSLPEEMWHAASVDPECSPPDVVRSALVDSVRAHLVADVDVGVFLSAGIDSGSLLGVASEEVQTRLSAVTVGFEEYLGSPLDEVPLAREVACLYGARHYVDTVTRPELAQSLPDIWQRMDQPSVDGVNSWLICRSASRAGVKVALSGLGGDEIFGGYSSFVTVPRWTRRLRGVASIPGAGRASRRLLSKTLPGRITPKAAGILEYGGSLEGVWFVRRGLFMPWELPALLGRERAAHALAELSVVEHLKGAVRPDPGTDLGRVAALEGGLYMRNQLLRDADWASMAHSLELRVPLVDVDLLRQVAPLLVQSWTKDQGKSPLAAAPRPELPHSVRTRQKTGFSIPLDQWLGQLDAHQAWRRVPELQRDGVLWSRRWAYVVADAFGLLGQKPRS